MPESERPAFMTNEKFDLLLKTLREYQDKTDIIITSFSLKTPVIVHGIIMEIELTVTVNL